MIVKTFKLTLLLFGLSILSCGTKERNVTSTQSETTANRKDTIEPIKVPSEEAEKLKDYQIEGINMLIALFNTRDIDKIANKINFPLNRQYPIPPIKNKEEFKLRFRAVFDEELIERIINSKIEQWSEVGWRGIMLDDGVIWMANSDGVITSVNYQSEYEAQFRKRLIAEDRQRLHPSLRDYESPVYKIKTNSRLIRIDELADYKYRYTSWLLGEKESSTPEMILNNGEWEFEGSGGNHVISFIQGDLIYNVYRNIMGHEDTADFTIELVKDEKVIRVEDGTQLAD